MDATLEPLVRDLLGWLERQPRSHAEFVETWRTSCPRLPVWEECTDNGFVRRRDGLLELTERGRSFLAAGR